MPKGVSQSSYRVVGANTKPEFSVTTPAKSCLRIILLVMLPLCGCMEVAGTLTGASGPQRDFFDITGSLAGNRSGFSLQAIEDADRPAALAALAQALDPMNDGQSSVWIGQSGHHRGTFSARGLAFVHDERLCRDFVAALESKRGVRETERQQWSGTACRQELGGAGEIIWRIVEASRVANNH